MTDACERSFSSRHGFSLVELMAALAVVSLMTVIGLPTVGLVRRHAVRTTCANNLRQLGTVSVLYASENNELFPADEHFASERPERSPAWFYRLPEYLGLRDVRSSIFQCSGFRWNGPAKFTNASPKSFKMNGLLNNKRRPRQYRMNSCSDESELMLFVDGVAMESGMGQWGHAATTSVDDSRHRGYANGVACDGSLISVRTPKDGRWDRAIRFESADWR
jgi:prepilin-type N-terminal cleavage/methylation domain-containing protein